ncbi:hypothetical protein K458DRAFT_321154 [Lentithecium fluviatile CBS 122367]|uniref:Uncharacterized protein n=1 Tax=Lentithecium fluviatile CBS 122367 TaxID=1168545 RepID=A0A6G1IFJ0_9PLEO|nr:hypothetical protein K458DRAFT_321154 [Lentithecium fluviatile CBS 122367]
MAKFLFCLVAVVSLLQCADALPDYDYDQAALTTPTTDAIFNATPIYPLKFQSFYPQLSVILEQATRGPCFLSLQAYEGNMSARTEKHGGVGNYCYHQNDCIISTLYESNKANMAAASVLLGLTPTILGTVGPAIAEVALLSSRRPLLSLLLSMGSPTAFPARFLAFEDPIKLLSPGRPSILNHSHLPVRFAMVASFLQYVFAIVAILNLITTSLELGLKTVLSWRCSVSWLPVIWAITPIACHAPAVLSFVVYQRKVKSHPQNNEKDIDETTLSSRKTLNSTDTRSRQRRSLSDRLRYAFSSEFTLSAKTDGVPIKKASKDVPPGAWSIIFQSMASLFGILQIIFGTAVFSSLLYIGVEDATRLLLKYTGSALCCRLIMYLELEGMIKVVQDEEEKDKAKRPEEREVLIVHTKEYMG